MPIKIFIHGLESSNRGTKGLFFKERYPDMVVPHFKGALPERMKGLRSILAGESQIRIVGSSFGGLMATLYAMENEPGVERLILLAPAIHILGTRVSTTRRISIPATIYHGTKDEVIPLEKVEEVAQEVFSNLSFHRVEDDHFLHGTFKAINWDQLLS